jgi:pimeloyl-ACP methyl ester carboxylesterase
LFGALTPEIRRDSEKMLLLNAIVDSLVPASDWVEGTMSDISGLLQTEFHLDAIQVPTLVIHGRRDAHLPLRSAQTHASGIPNARLLILENATHFAVATHKDEIAAAVEHFLSG